MKFTYNITFAHELLKSPMALFKGTQKILRARQIVHVSFTNQQLRKNLVWNQKLRIYLFKWNNYFATDSIQVIAVHLTSEILINWLRVPNVTEYQKHFFKKFTKRNLQEFPCCLAHCSGVNVFILKAWMIFISSSKAAWIILKKLKFINARIAGHYSVMYKNVFLG